MNHIDQLFERLRRANRKAFMPFLPAGDPDLGFTKELLTTVAGAGADLIEVGFPFSDPIADGPVIQASYTRALRNHLKINDLLTMVAEVTALPGWNTPLVAMASYSLIFKMGPAEFVRQAQAVGFSGAVVPDLPAEEAEEIATLCRANDFKLILLVTPTTQPERMAKIVAACSGFVYVVSVVGITGGQAGVVDVVHQVTQQLRQYTDLPLCVGFGVSTPEQVVALRPVCDGVIVGSAFVKYLNAITPTDGKHQARVNIQTLATTLSAALNPTHPA
jgi:tryptophan synthase alpha chain